MIETHAFEKYSKDLWSETNKGLVRSLVHCAVLAYQEKAAVENALAEYIHDDSFDWFSKQSGTSDTQAFAFRVQGTNDIVIAFRGTKEIRDFLTDIRLKPRALRAYDTKEYYEGKHAVHSGFQEALDVIWERLKAYWDKQAMNGANRVFFTGHSLGGALANVAAARSGINGPPICQYSSTASITGATS